MDYQQALEEKVKLRTVLTNDDFERMFRSDLRSKNERLVTYLVSDEILGDLVDSIVNEEDRSLSEASEALGILLSNLDPITDSLVEKFLPTFFNYLKRETTNPRRMYFFLRIISFLSQNRTPEVLTFAINTPGLTQQLVDNLASPHIVQLLTLWLTVEKQMKSLGVPELDWSGKTNLIGCLVLSLDNDPDAKLEVVGRFLQEITNQNELTSPTTRSTISESFIDSIVKLTANKSVSADAIRVLDEHIFRVIMQNTEDVAYFSEVSSYINKHIPHFQSLLQSPSLSASMIGVRFVQAAIKNGANFAVGAALSTCFDLFFRYPWSNILHNALVVIFQNVFKSQDPEFILPFLKNDVVKKLVTGLASSTPSGYKAHLRTIASELQEVNSPVILEFLKEDELWVRFTQIMETRKQSQLSFISAEKEFVESLAELLSPNPERIINPCVVQTKVETIQEKENEGEKKVVAEENTEKKEDATEEKEGDKKTEEVKVEDCEHLKEEAKVDEAKEGLKVEALNEVKAEALVEGTEPNAQEVKDSKTEDVKSEELNGGVKAEGLNEEQEQNSQEVKDSRTEESNEEVKEENTSGQ